jgi:Ca-activated chloride channel family protein
MTRGSAPVVQEHSLPQVRERALQLARNGRAGDGTGADVWNDFRFADPWVLGLLPLVVLAALIYRRLQPGRPRGGVVLSTLAPLGAARPSWRIRLRPLLVAGRLLAIGLIVVALARPQTIEANATVASEGIDIVLAFDISGSMDEQGLDSPSKIEGAKKALKQFLGERKDDRVGLVVFKSEARVLSPLTTDYKALERLVDQADKLNRGVLPEGTAIGLGIADSLNLLRSSQARSRVVILATDGENNQMRVEPEQAGKMAEVLKVRVYTIGIPTARSRPEETLDERQMRRIAESTGGRYERAANQQGLADIYTSITTLEKSRIERERFTRYNELAPWLLLPAFGLIVLESLLGTTLFRRAP